MILLLAKKKQPEFMMHDAYCMMVNVKDGTIIATRTAFILCWMLQWHDALTQW